MRPMSLTDCADGHSRIVRIVSARNTVKLLATHVLQIRATLCHIRGITKNFAHSDAGSIARYLTIMDHLPAQLQLFFKR